MKIIYILTIVSIYILFMLLFKTEKRQNLIKWGGISAILVLCYNTFLCVMLTLVNILSTLQNLIICNSIVMILLLTFIIKKKKLQKYYVKKIDIIFSILLVILVLFIGYKQYGFSFNLDYSTTDASSHYYYAEQFQKSSTLIYNATTEDFLNLYNGDFRLPMAYVNEGILFKLFDDVLLKTELFILFDLLILYLSGILFYYLVKAKITKENKKLQILAVIFSVMYVLGYQLNSMLYGYVYLSVALTIIITFLLVISKREEIIDEISLPILSLISFGIFFSYAYFVPIIYIAIIIDILVKSIKKKEKIISSPNITSIVYLIIMPLLLGGFYFIVFPMIKVGNTEISTIRTDGKIYENYITNFIVFIPVIIIDIILKIKNRQKNINFETILFVLSIIFAILLVIGYKFEIVSKYYFLKSYYIIWLLALYNTYTIICNSNKKLQIGTFIYIIVYIAIVTIITICQKNIGINDIFLHNLNEIKAEKNLSILNSNKIKNIQLFNKLTDGHEAYIFSPQYKGKIKWMTVLLNNQQFYAEYIITGKRNNITEWLQERKEKYYFAYYTDYKELEENYPTESNEQYKIIYNDEYSFVLERK